jgi:hypothetical protein
MRTDVRSHDAAVAFYRFVYECSPDAFPIGIGIDDAPDFLVTSPTDQAGIDEWLETARRGTLSVGMLNKNTGSVIIDLVRGGVAHLIPSISVRRAVNSEPCDGLGSRFLTAFLKLAETLPADFVRICTRDEWVEKNVIRGYPEPDGYLNPWKVFGQDLNTMFPGVYWANYFGKDLAEWAGCAKWKLKRWHRFEPFADGYLLVRSPTISTWRAEVDADRELIEAIGPDRIFSKANLPKLPQGPALPVSEYTK